MNFRSLAFCGLTVGTLLAGGASPAQAMNLLVAVGSPQIQLVIAQDGAVKVIQAGEERDIIEVSNVEPAAGAQDTSSEE